MKVISESDIIFIKEYPYCSGVQTAQMVWSLNCLNTLSLFIAKRNSTQRKILALQFFKCSFICKARNIPQHYISL